MISRLIGGFVAILLGVSLIGPVQPRLTQRLLEQTTPGVCGEPGFCGDLYNASSWGATVLKLVPGFFRIGNSRNWYRCNVRLFKRRWCRVVRLKEKND